MITAIGIVLIFGIIIWVWLVVSHEYRA